MMKKILDAIPTSRLVLYLVVLSFLPLIFVGYTYLNKKSEWDEVSRKMLAIHTLSEVKARKQALNTVVRKTYGGADPFYLDNQLEKLLFLKKEREALRALLENPSFTGNEGAEKRFAFLSGNENRIQFTEGSAQSGEGVEESLQTLAHPIEVDTKDLKEILGRLEGNRTGKPQLMITDFKLDKKKYPTENEVFELNLKLLKREFS